MTIRNVQPPTVYSVTPTSAHAGIHKARVAAVANRINRRMDAILQRMDHLLDAKEERERERRRRGR